jgi:hypothetical protein
MKFRAIGLPCPAWYVRFVFAMRKLISFKERNGGRLSMFLGSHATCAHCSAGEPCLEPTAFIRPQMYCSKSLARIPARCLQRLSGYTRYLTSLLVSGQGTQSPKCHFERLQILLADFPSCPGRLPSFCTTFQSPSRDSVARTEKALIAVLGRCIRISRRWVVVFEEEGTLMLWTPEGCARQQICVAYY